MVEVVNMITYKCYLQAGIAISFGISSGGSTGGIQDKIANFIYTQVLQVSRVPRLLKHPTIDSSKKAQKVKPG
jgi:hypothetical protein